MELLSEGNAKQINRNNKLAKISIILAFIGLLDSIYLSWIKIANKEAACAGIGDCDVVNTSIYSEISGIPIALFGAGAYLLMIILLIIETQGIFDKENSRLILFGMSLIGVLYSAYLTYIEVAVIHAICPFCVISAIIIVALFFISIVRLGYDPE